MSADELTQAVGEKLSRSRFVKRVTLLVVGAASLFGIAAEDARAVQWGCCNLCFSPTSPCGVCSWCWICCTEAGFKFRCCEGFQAGGCCANCCTGAICSWGETLGKCFGLPAAA